MARRFGLAAICLGIAALLTAIAAVAPRQTLVAGWVADITVAVRVAVFGAAERPGQVLVVAIDQRSLDHPRLVGVPRALFTPVLGEVVAKAMDGGALVVGIDLILAYDAAGLELGGARPLTGYDTDFLRLLRAPDIHGRVILGRSAQVLPAARFARVAGAEQIGMVEVGIDPTGVVREMPSAFADSDGILRPTLSGRLLAASGNPRNEPVVLLPDAPLDMMPAVSLIDLLECGDEARLANLFEGRTVLIGSTLPGEDRLKSADRLMPPAPRHPLGQPCDFVAPDVREPGGLLPGVYLHAAAVDAVLSGWAPRPASDGARLALVFALALAGAAAACLRRPLLALLAVTAALVAGFSAGVWALEHGTWLPADHALGAAVVGAALSGGTRLGLLDRQRRSIKRAFGRFLSPVLVERMVQTGETPELGGEEREVTVMFADLSGFTATSEKMASTDLTRILNRYLDAISRAVAAHEGYVDKFIGDAVMAMWNAPATVEDHAGKATAAALAIRDAVADQAARDRAAGLPEFTIKVGLTTGPATVGNIGARDRMDFTVIGETVNLAARLESLPGLLRTPVVIGPETAVRVEDRFVLLPLVAIRVKGKSVGVTVYAPLARRDAAPPDLGARIAAYGEALRHFEAGEFAAARKLWSELAIKDWPGAGAAAAMAEEAEMLAIEAPAVWTGVLEARGK